MNRLLTAKTTATSGAPCWGQEYVYDRFPTRRDRTPNLSAINIPSGYSSCDNGLPLSLSINDTNNKITNANFSYDAAGNLTASPVGYSYTWNAEGRMATAVAGGVTYTYTYNGDGQRVKKAAASASSYDKLYWYGLADNGGSQVLAESALDGTLTSEYIFMGATRIARRDVSSGNVYYFLGDRLGNARIVTNSTGGIVEESDFLPYGTERTITDSLDNNYKFTGHERDGETSLDHTLYRQHSSTLGRWLSADPKRGQVSNPQAWNRYSYGANSPCNFIDPDGREHAPPPPPFQPPGQYCPTCGESEGFMDALWREALERQRQLQELLKAAMKDMSLSGECAGALGAESADVANDFLQSYFDGRREVVFAWQGDVKIDANGSVAPIPFGSNNLSNNGSIILNESINWNSPSNTWGFSPSGPQPIDLLAAAGTQFGNGGPLTATQFMQFAFLHEFSHNFLGVNKEPIDRDIFQKCIKRED